MTRGRLLALLAGVAVLAAVAVVLVLALGTDDGTAEPPDPVTVSPVPGGRWASPKTEISLRGIASERLGTIEVSGSKSGSHKGRLQPHFDGEGASFVPDEPFEAGEEVKVSTDLTIPGARDGDYRFWVSRPAEPPPPRTMDRPGGPVQRFASRPDLVVPRVTIRKRDPRRHARRGVHRAQARLRPQRPDDLRRGGPAHLGARGAAEHGGVRLPRPALSRPARAHLVGGHLDARRRLRRGRGARPGLPRADARPGGQRLRGRPARVPDHPARHRAAARLRVRQRRPHVGQGPEGRQGDRRRRAGGRPRDGPRPVRVAQPGPRELQGGLLAAARGPDARRRGTTSTSTRSGSTATATCSSTRATPGRRTRSTAGPGPCAGGSAARRATSSSTRTRSSPTSTTSAAVRTARSRCSTTPPRRRRRPTSSRAAWRSSSTRAPARRASRTSTRTRTGSCRRPRATCRCCRTATSSSAGALSRCSRSSTPTASCCSTAGSPRATTTTGRTSATGAAGRRRSRRWSSTGGARWRAGTAPPCTRAGSCWPVRAGPRCGPPGRRARRRASRPRCRSRPAPRSSPPARSGRAGRTLAESPPVEVGAGG